MRLYGVWRLQEHLGLLLLQLLLVVMVEAVDGRDRRGPRHLGWRVTVQQQLKTTNVVNSTAQSFHLAHLLFPCCLRDVLS